MLGGPEEFRVGITYVESGKPTAFELRNQMTAHQAKIDRPGSGLLNASDGISTKRHCRRG